MNPLGTLTTIQPESILFIREEMEKVDRYIGYDGGLRKGQRRIRPNSSPEFALTIILKTDEDFDEVECVATIVATNVPESSTDQVEPGAPLAIASVEIDGNEYYLLISRSRGRDNDLYISDVLLSYDGEPEELFSQTELFDPEG